MLWKRPNDSHCTTALPNAPFPQCSKVLVHLFPTVHYITKECPTDAYGSGSRGPSSLGSLLLSLTFFTSSLTAAMVDTGTIIDSELCSLATANPKCSEGNFCELQSIHKFANTFSHTNFLLNGRTHPPPCCEGDTLSSLPLLLDACLTQDSLVPEPSRRRRSSDDMQAVSLGSGKWWEGGEEEVEGEEGGKGRGRGR